MTPTPIEIKDAIRAKAPRSVASCTRAEGSHLDWIVGGSGRRLDL
jgi:hypothetical protein